MNQPYQAPAADVAAASDETYQPKFLSLSGRIGRMRYFVYGTGLTALFYLVMALVGVVAAIAVPSLADGGAAGPGVIGLGLIGIASFIVILVMTWGYMVRRLNDINASGWLSLLMLVPIVNLVLGLVLLFKKGSEGGNDYGAKPVPNSGGVKGAFAVLLILLVGYVGIVIPMTISQYGEYVQRAEAAQQMQAEDFGDFKN